MPEYCINWFCPKCENRQKQVCRVSKEKNLNDNIILEKAKKTKLICKFCPYSIKWINLGSSYKKFGGIR